MGAWIETHQATKDQNSYKSHPTWVRGLKLSRSKILINKRMSHPTWVRGLKLAVGSEWDVATSRTLHGCVD